MPGGPLTGKVFEAEIRRSLDHFGESHPGFWWMRLSDYRSWVAVNPKLVAPKQPADFLAVYRGRVFFLECKSTKYRYGWDSSRLKPHQREALLAVSSAGGSAWILIRDHSVPRHNRAWALHISTYDLLRERLPPNRVSFGWADLDEFGIRLPLLKGKIWDLSGLFGVAV